MLRRQIAAEKEEIERLRAEIADIQRWNQAGVISACEWVLTAHMLSPRCIVPVQSAAGTQRNGGVFFRQWEREWGWRGAADDPWRPAEAKWGTWGQEIIVIITLNSLVMSRESTVFAHAVACGMQHLNFMLFKHQSAFTTNLFFGRVLEQKHPPEPGHPWRTGSHLRASCPASPPAEPQTAAGNNCPTTIWASPAHAAEPRAPQRGASQTHHCTGSLQRRHSRLFQRQSGKRSFKAFAK